MATDSVKGTLGVAAALCIVCSVLVSGMAVGLKEKQDENRALDIKKNILLSAGILTDDTSKEAIVRGYQKIKEVLINLKSGQVDTSFEVSTFDANSVAKDPSARYLIPKDKDLAKIKVRAPQAKIYLVQTEEGLESLILPVHGKGLWSTLYGFITLDAHNLKVKGFAFYKHGETPGLGGEVDNPLWKASWIGKTVLDDSLKPVLKVVKTGARLDTEVDALSGATITSVGVQSLIHYWLGEDGFGPFLASYKSGGIK